VKRKLLLSSKQSADLNTSSNPCYEQTPTPLHINVIKTHLGAVTNMIKQSVSQTVSLLFSILAESSPRYCTTNAMAPSAIDSDLPISTKGAVRSPLRLSGALDSYESFDVTPIIGREFPTAKLVEWLEAPNSDELLRDLAITSESYYPYYSNSQADESSLPTRCGIFPGSGWSHQRTPEETDPASG
jgi:hypothetical protein